MFTLFVFGSMFFWALCVLEVILLFTFTENENGFGATMSLLLFGAALQWMGDVNIIGFIKDHPMHILAGFVAYLILGTLTGILKWRGLVRERTDQLNEAWAKFLTDQKLPADTKILPSDDLKKAWSRIALENKHDKGGNYKLEETPLVSRNKARIMRWMSLWPVVAIWWVIDDFVKGIFRTIYRNIANYLQEMANAMFAKHKQTSSENLVEDYRNYR